MKLNLTPSSLQEYIKRRDSGEWEDDIQWELEVLKHVLRPSLTHEQYLAFDDIEYRIASDYIVEPKR